ncbi:organic cation transporter protein-like [Amphiura filiformis]|uniref:organic cation transporter protein-like n=1 Tax=Amphiura filiformis TaxID=82378 RepID=UPI003B225C83
MLLFGLLMQTSVGVGAAFAPNFPVFCIMQFLLGMTSSGIFVTAYVIGTELVGPSKRALAGIAIRIFYSLGMMLLAVLAWVLRDWPKIELVISVPPIIFLVYYWILPESPRWLISQGREEEALQIIKRAAKINKVKLKYVETNIPGKQVLQSANGRPVMRRRHSAVDLVRTPNMRFKTIKIYFNWISSSMAYYGLSFMTEDLGSDPFLAFFIAGAVEIPAYILCLLFLNRFGRKWLTSIFMVAGGVALLCAIPVPNEYTNMTLAIAMVGKLCISGSYAIVYLYAAELFPTPIRNAGVGMGSFTSRIGSILAPQILLLGDAFTPQLPIAIFGGLALVAGLLVLLLPETLNKKLPETMEEGEAFGKGKSAWRRMTGQSSKLNLAAMGDLPAVFETAPPVKESESESSDNIADVTISVISRSHRANDIAVQTSEEDFGLDNPGFAVLHQ